MVSRFLNRFQLSNFKIRPSAHDHCILEGASAAITHMDHDILDLHKLLWLFKARSKGFVRHAFLQIDSGAEVDFPEAEERHRRI